MLNVEPLATPHKDNLNKSNMKSTGAKEESSEMHLDDIKVKEFDLGSDSIAMKTKKIAKKKRS